MPGEDVTRLGSQLDEIQKAVSQLAVRMQEIAGEVHRSSEVASVTLHALSVRVQGLSDDLVAVRSRLEARYVTQLEFRPVRAVVFGMVGLVLASVLGALVAVVVERGG